MNITTEWTIFFCHDSVENVASTDIFRVLHLQAAIQKVFNHNSQILSIFVLPFNFLTFRCKPCDFVADDCKIMVH